MDEVVCGKLSISPNSLFVIGACKLAIDTAQTMDA